MNFLVMTEGVQIEEGFATRETCQPHPQVLSAYVCTDISTYG